MAHFKRENGNVRPNFDKNGDRSSPTDTAFQLKQMPGTCAKRFSREHVKNHDEALDFGPGSDKA